MSDGKWNGVSSSGIAVGFICVAAGMLTTLLGSLLGNLVGQWVGYPGDGTNLGFTVGLIGGLFVSSGVWGALR